MKTKYKLIVLIVVACLLSIVIYKNIDKVVLIEKKKDIFETQLALEKEFLKDTSYSVLEPKIIVNPYQISPLSALVIFETNDFTNPMVTIKGKDEHTTYTNTFKTTNIHVLPIYGLYPDTNNEVIITVNEVDYPIYIKTEPLPDDFILPENVKAKKNKLNNELYFVTPSSSGYTAAYDVNGDVRWYTTNNYAWDIKRLNNGHIMLSSDRLINPPYYTVGLIEMDLLGKVYFEYTLPGGYHHDVYEMKDGNLLVASNNFIDHTVEDYIVEIDRKTGKIVKEIDLKDILPTDEGLSPYATKYDWFHNNSVWYDEITNSITLSGRHKDAVININYDTLKLNWIIGDKTTWSEEMHKYFFTPTNNLEWQWAQHAAMILPNGNVFIFDNGNNRSKIEEKFISADDNYSRGVIYKINTNNMTISQEWEYGKNRGSKYYSPYISDVDYLKANHYLIHSGGHGEIDGHTSNTPAAFSEGSRLNSITVEVLNNEVIYELNLPGHYYRTEKLNLYANDEYTPGIGKRLGSLGITPTNDNKLLFLKKEANGIKDKYNLNVFKESDRLVVNGIFKQTDEVQIILDNLFDKKTYNVIIAKRPYTAMCIDIFNEEEIKNGLNITKYINDEGLSGKYYIYIKINGTIYTFNKYVIF
ncbi:MAG: aryl-sulfate sulfotransferase [Bacilli bacterium]|nr:aryl-sulfate sulfotransferase [Bacilli bacterium]MDD4808427.1 aryl-sulfate sulfotransferase [Bacilli bacterium]